MSASPSSLSWWFETVKLDLRYALRQFRLNRVLTLTIVITLALGIGVTTAVFSVVDRILFQELPYAHPDRLVSVGLTAPIFPQEFMLGGSYYDWRDNQKPFQALTSETGVAGCDLTERNPQQLKCAAVEQNFLPTLGLSPILGRNFEPEEDRPNAPKVVLISHDLWTSHYGSDPTVLNKPIHLDGQEAKIVGVLPKEFELPTLQHVDVIVPEELNEAEQRKSMPGAVMYAFARLKPGVSVEQAKASLQPVFNYSLSLTPPAFRNEVHLKVQSIRDRQVQDVRLVAWVLLGAAIAVLLIACANVMSLLVARAATREKEHAVRFALGATRSRLARQMLTEALLLSLIGAIGGCAVAEGLLRLFVAIAPSGLPFLKDAELDLRIILLTIAVSFACGIGFGIFPALQKARTSALGRRTAVSSQNAIVRQVVIIGQIAVCMVLLTSAALLLRSFTNMMRQNLGMQTEGVLAVHIALPTSRYATAQSRLVFYLGVENAMRRMPGVSSIGIADSMPPGEPPNTQIYNVISIAGKPHTLNGTGGLVDWRWVTPGYFHVLGIPVMRGQAFAEQNRSSSERLMMLSSTLARRLFGDANPIGQRIQPMPNGNWFTVAGVVPDVKNAGLSGLDSPEYYLLRRNNAADWGWDGGGTAHTVILLKTSQLTTGAASWTRTLVAQVDPTVPVDVQALTDNIAQLADRARFETALLGFFAASGLLMAVIGLYSVVSFLATQRTQEIGIRMALGATSVDIFRLINWEGLRLILLGAILGGIAAYGVTQLLRSLLFNVGPHNPVVYIEVAGLLSFFALLATLIPAQAAMKVEPVVALRSE